MKKRMALLLAALLALLCACGRAGASWQEQYDLGVRYLSEGNYQEAILAFNAAIEIDPARADAYVGRGDAYVLSGETAENLAAAQADYEKALELDGTLADVYIALADVYMMQGDYDRAMEILQQGLEEAGDNAAIAGLLEELESVGGAAGGLNAFGATEFTQRRSYTDYDQLTALEQELVQLMANAAIQGDFDAMEAAMERALASPEFPQWGMGGATMWNGYKIGWGISEGFNESGDRHCSASIEMRPENGAGYHCFVWHYDAVDTAGRENWYDSDSNEWVTCPCVGWQWNGTMRRVEDYYFDWRSADGSYSNEVTHTEEAGTMVNSLRDGTFTCNSHREADSLYAAAYGGEPSFSASDDEYTEVYQNGFRVGEDADPSVLYGLLNGISNGGVGDGSLSDPEFLESFYW